MNCVCTHIHTAASLSAKALTPPPWFGMETRLQEILSRQSPLQPVEALNKPSLFEFTPSFLTSHCAIYPPNTCPISALCSSSLGSEQELWLGVHKDLGSNHASAIKATLGKQ